MADNTQKVGVQVEVQGAEKSIASIKDLKNAIKEARDEQVKMGEQFGTNSKQFQDASKNVANLKDKVDDLSDSTNSLKGTGVEQLTQGFGQLKEGVMNLDIDKIKIGLNSMKSGIMQFGSSAMTSLSGVQKAMIATGIGAFLVALGLIIAYWDELKGLVSGVSSEQEKLNKQSQQNLDTEKAKQDALGSQDNILKQQGKSEKEILQMKIKQTDETIKASEIQIQNSIATNEAQVKAAARNREILEGLLKFVSLPITAILKGIDAIGSAVGKDFGLEDKFFGSISKMVFDPDEVKANGDKSLEEQKKALDKLKNDRAGFQNTIKKIDDDANAKSIENANKLRDANLAALKQLEDAQINNIKNEEERQFARAVKDKERRDEEINKSKISKDLKNAQLIESEKTLAFQLNAINEKSIADKKALDDKAAADKKALDDKAAADKLAQDEKNQEFLEAYYKKENDLFVENQAKEKASREESRANAIKIAEQTLQSVQNVTDIFFTIKSAKLKKGSAEELALAKKQFNVNKALQLGLAVIDGYKAVTSSLASAPVAIGPVPNPAGIASLAFAVTTSLANIAKIAASKFEGGGGGPSAGGSPSGGGGASIPGPPTISNQNANVDGTQFDENGRRIGSKNDNTINVVATVGVDEITAKTNRVNVLENQATF
jgi:hypothetical protein